MGVFSDTKMVVAPEPTSTFEAYMIQFAQRATVEFVNLHQSIDDLAESIAFVASTILTKEEFRKCLNSAKSELREDIANSEHYTPHR